MDALPPDLDVLAMKVERAQLFKELREEYGFVSRASETDTTYYEAYSSGHSTRR
jgi:hypothetical protein